MIKNQKQKETKVGHFDIRRLLQCPMTVGMIAAAVRRRRRMFDISH
jgi:hypothetical protein